MQARTRTKLLFDAWRGLGAMPYKKLSDLKIIQLEIKDKEELACDVQQNIHHENDKWLFADDDGLNLVRFIANTKNNKYKCYGETER